MDSSGHFLAGTVGDVGSGGLELGIAIGITEFERTARGEVESETNSFDEVIEGGFGLLVFEDDVLLDTGIGGGTEEIGLVPVVFVNDFVVLMDNGGVVTCVLWEVTDLFRGVWRGVLGDFFGGVRGEDGAARLCFFSDGEWIGAGSWNAGIVRGVGGLVGASEEPGREGWVDFSLFGCVGGECGESALCFEGGEDTGGGRSLGEIFDRSVGNFVEETLLLPGICFLGEGVEDSSTFFGVGFGELWFDLGKCLELGSEKGSIRRSDFLCENCHWCGGGE